MTMKESCKTVFLGAICLVVIATYVRSHESLIHPFGPQMCERRCQNTIGCTIYIFGIHDLSCHVTDAKPLPRESFTSFPALENRNTSYRDTIRSCPKFAKIFQNRRQTTKCSRRLTKQEKHVKMAKLFFLLSSPSQPLQARVLFLHNSSVVTYPYYIKGRFRAVAYISSYRRLIIGTYASRQVVFMSVTDGKQTVVKESIAVHSIAVDETKGLVFLKIYLKKYMICAMTTEGNDYKMVFIPKSEPEGVTVDYKRSRIYIALRDGIYMYSYQGGYKGRMALKTIFKLLFVDTENDVLYYSTIHKHIYEMSMSDKKSTHRFKKTFYYVRELIRFESTIFMRILNQKSILVLSKNGTRSYIKTDLATSDYRMCLID